MAKYIKQEMIDLSGKGEEKAYYRLQPEILFNINKLEVDCICKLNSPNIKIYETKTSLISIDIIAFDRMST